MILDATDEGLVTPSFVLPDGLFFRRHLDDFGRGGTEHQIAIFQKRDVVRVVLVREFPFEFSRVVRNRDVHCVSGQHVATIRLRNQPHG
jgi:hypothetical protein